jgi:ferredoxin
VKNRQTKTHRISILDTDEHYFCDERQHLLAGMLSLGKKGIPVGCRGGGCGVCKVKIFADSKRYKTVAMSRAHVSAKEQSEGVVLACRTYAHADLKLNVVGGIRKNVLRKNTGFNYHYG